MQRLSQVSLHLSHTPRDGVIETKSSSTPPTPRPADCSEPSAARTNTNMAKTKVVVTRQLIEEAQRILDATKEDLEVVQWQSEKVCFITGDRDLLCSQDVCSHAHAPGCLRTPKVQVAS